MLVPHGKLGICMAVETRAAETCSQPNMGLFSSLFPLAMKKEIHRNQEIMGQSSLKRMGLGHAK